MFGYLHRHSVFTSWQSLAQGQMVSDRVWFYSNVEHISRNGVARRIELSMNFSGFSMVRLVGGDVDPAEYLTIVTSYNVRAARQLGTSENCRWKVDRIANEISLLLNNTSVVKCACAPVDVVVAGVWIYFCKSIEIQLCDIYREAVRIVRHKFLDWSRITKDETRLLIENRPHNCLLLAFVRAIACLWLLSFSEICLLVSIAMLEKVKTRKLIRTMTLPLKASVGNEFHYIKISECG